MYLSPPGAPTTELGIQKGGVLFKTNSSHGTNDIIKRQQKKVAATRNVAAKYLNSI